MKGETTRFGAGANGRGISAVAALVRQHDRERYQTALFAPSSRREALFALYAFNYEIARVREIVTTPMLGQIRLQWWRDVIDVAYAGGPPRHHVAAAPLAAMIGDYSPSRGLFDRLIDAREQDLADEPPATLAALEDYATASSASLLRLALEILGIREEAASAAAHHVGIAYALTGLLRAMAFHARAGRSYIPQDIAAETGLDPGDYTRLRSTPALRAATERLAAAAAAHLRLARNGRGDVPRAALPALLPAVVAGRALARLRRARWNPFDPRVAMLDPLLPWCLAAAMLRWRF